MPDSTERKDEKGLSARILILLFVMGVAACAVFFSLGFVVGFTERPHAASNITEEVDHAAETPPVVNLPLEPLSPGQDGAISTPAAEKQSESVAPAPAPKAEPKADPKPPAPAVQSSAKKPATKPAKTTASAQQQKEPRAGYIVQVAASSDKTDAEKLVKELRGRGFDVFVVPPQFSEAKDNLYRVQLGPYGTREEAVRVRDRISKEGFKPFIKN